MAEGDMSWEKWGLAKLYRLGTPEGEHVIDKNVQMIEEIFAGLWKRCGNPYCQYPISSISAYGAPEYGDICATCHDLYSALTFPNKGLRDREYFKKLHDAWKKNGGDDWRNRRDKLGM